MPAFLLVAALLFPPSATPALHLSLQRSAPAAASSGAAPTEIRLWFSQRPQRGSTSITLTGRGGTRVPLGEVRSEGEGDRVFAAPVREPLTPGTYRVSWRTMAADGHVIRGDFSFTVEGG